MGSRPLAQSRGAREEPPALLTRTLTDYAREMNDAPERLRASLTRLARLYARSGLEVTDFHALMHAARVTALARGNIEKEAERGTPYGTPKNRLPYWFTVLEGLALSS